MPTREKFFEAQALALTGRVDRAGTARSLGLSMTGKRIAGVGLEFTVARVH
jgi:hypothetical protein